MPAGRNTLPRNLVRAPAGLWGLAVFLAYAVIALTPFEFNPASPRFSLDTLAAFPGGQAVGPMLVACLLGLFSWRGASARTPGTAQAGLTTLAALLAAVAVWLAAHARPAPTLADVGLIWIGLGVGMGALLAWLGRGLPWPGGRQWPPLFDLAWRILLLAGAALVLVPMDASGGSDSTVDNGLRRYGEAVAEQLYELIRIAILGLPIGFLFSLDGRGQSLQRLAVSLCAALPAISLLLTGDFGGLLLRDLLFLMPGLALGIRLGDPAGLRPWHSSAVATSPPSLRPAAPIQSPQARPPQPGASAASVWPPWPRRAMAVLCAALCAWSLWGFPAYREALAMGLCVYAMLLWRWPQLWLVVVPAALPLLDLAPWTGRFLWDEFDLLMLVTLAMSLWRNKPAPRAAIALTSSAAVALFCLSYLGSGLIGLWPLPTLDANAFYSYWSTLNSLRVGKGLLWALVIAYLMRRQSTGPSASWSRHFAIGMAAGLSGVCLVGLRERWLFAGLWDLDQPYRIVSVFSSMHTGGGHIEAYLVAAMPFLWLALARRTWLLVPALPLFLLAVYVTLTTVSRGGALALGLVLAILLLGSLRQALSRRPAGDSALTTEPRSRRTGQHQGPSLAVAAALTLSAMGMMFAAMSQGYFLQRLEQAEQDWHTRLAHWRDATGLIGDGLGNTLLGMGLGRFPASYLYHNPQGKPLATYSHQTERDNAFLRLGFGETLYMAQKVAIATQTRYRLAARLRGAGGRLDVPLCEKQLLDSGQCRWQGFSFPADGQWHEVETVLDSGEVGAGNWLTRRPVELFLHNPGTALVDVDAVRLYDPSGRDLLRNGDFSRGGDHWFFKTHSHLPWHIKNLWVEVYFSQGWLGLLALFLFLAVFLGRMLPAWWRGDPLAATLLAGVAGMLAVGLFDSLLDAPRLATLFLALLLFGLLYRSPAHPAVGMASASGSVAQEHGGRRRNGQRRRSGRHAASDRLGQESAAHLQQHLQQGEIGPEGSHGLGQSVDIQQTHPR